MTTRLLEEYASGESHIPDEEFIADLTGIVYIGAYYSLVTLESE